MDPGEQCDFGSGNGPGTGCETNCTFSCTLTPDSCATTDPCSGAVCTAITVNGQAGQKCLGGTPAADGTPCGTGEICLAAMCKMSVCGDGYVDASRGEQCEPPNTVTCDANCHSLTAANCGNGVRDPGEQCDDGNNTNLDGCSASCEFEQDQRINWLKMQFATDAACTLNALGGAITQTLAQQQLQTTIDTGVGNGTISVLFETLGLTDLSGQSPANFSIGIMNGAPITGAGYSGTADLDWWYNPDPNSIDANRVPMTKMPASIQNGILTAGPSAVVINLTLGGALSPIDMSNVVVTVSIGASSIPKVSANANPPGHLPSENLDPALQSFASTGQQNANGAGALCGNVSAYALSQAKLPSSVTTACTQFTTNNSILDLIVNGCTAFGFLTVVNPTQPDQSAGMPVGAGPAYMLSGSPVSTCTDATGATVNLTSCLQDAAYSAYFKFASDRVIIK
jgi:cysteine-rich repeat protein